jgi:RND family efflux transporter MFP subunit
MKFLFSIPKKIFAWLRSHKIIVSLAAFLIILGIIYLPSRIRKAVLGAEAEYDSVKPRTTDLTQIIDASGEIKAQEQATLKFQASGKLNWIGVEKGDQVKKWQAIASLDRRTIKKNLEKEIYDYLSERWDFEQDHSDYGSSGLPLDKSPLTDAAKRVLEKAQFDLNQSILDLEIDQISYELAVIYSPIDGIVTDIESPIPGVNITAATAEFTVANPEVMIFEALIDEADIGLAKTGQKATISLDAYPDQAFEGQIQRIDFASRTTSGGGTAFAAEILLPENESLRFKIGMNGDVEIIIQEKKEVLSIPLKALKEKNGQSFVQIIENKKLKEIEVQTGLATDTRVEVISGLGKDQKVVTGKKKQAKK